MTANEKKILQELEGKYWFNLCEAHHDFMQRNGTFDTFELYNEELSKDKRHNYWLIKWCEISYLCKKFKIEKNAHYHNLAAKLNFSEPRAFKN